MRAAALLATYPNPLRVCDSADFDGTNDFMTRGGLTGAVDSKLGIFSCWYRRDLASVTQYLLTGSFADGAASVLFGFNTSDQIFVNGNQDNGGAGALSAISTSTYAQTGVWKHILCSWDTGNSKFLLVVDDVADAVVPSFVNAAIDVATNNWAVGAIAQTGNLGRIDAQIAELYYAPAQWMDFALVANRRKFRSASGKPVHLGTTGALPTGTAPLIYLHLDDAESAANFATNRGTGGNFTITGALTTGSTSPSD